MAMLSSLPLRSSLTVAPLSIHKSATALSHGYEISASTATYQESSAPSVSSGLTAATTVYSHSRMTPPTTPNGSQEDLSHADQYDQSYSTGGSMHNFVFSSEPDPPPVFHNFLRAYYAFHPSFSPADSTVTLPMNEGDVILVHSIHTNGWADGTLLVSGARGWLPTNYCDAYEPEEMHNLLNALLNFWDLMRSTTINDSEIFGNQEFMKGIIAGVRYLLERTSCLTRESALIQRHDGLRRGRKSLLSELSSLVKSAKRLQEYQRQPLPGENVNDIIDEMILKAFKIVTKAVRFFDILEDDRRQRTPAVAVMATVLEESTVPPTPPAESLTFDANNNNNNNNRTSYMKTLPASDSSASLGAASQSALAVNKRLSNVSRNSYHRLSQSNSPSTHRLSSSTISHRVSLAGPSPLSQPHNLVSHRLSDRHDTFLSYLGSFIGRLHLQSQSRPHLALAIKQSATSGGQLLVVVDVVSGHDSLSREILHQLRAAMSSRILELACLARDILTNPCPEAEDVIMPQDNGRLLTAATDCVKATGECVAKTKWVIERIGDFEYAFDDATVALDFDFSVFDTVDPAVAEANGSHQESPSASEAGKVGEQRQHQQQYPAASDSSSTARSTSSTEESVPVPTKTTSHKAVPSLPSVDATAASPAQSSTGRSSLNKPLPEVPQVSSPVEEKSQPLHLLAAASRPQSFIGEESLPASMVSSTSSLRPALPVLPKLSTSLLVDDYGHTEPSRINDGEPMSSLRSDSLLAINSATTTSTYASRDSESSLVSQSSTRASTPDVALAPRNQPSMSELSTTTTSSMLEENEDEVETRLLERTYAHELMFNKEGQVTGGSLPALVERLTTHESTPDAMFVSTFYLTFRLFCSPFRLAEALISRFEYAGESPNMASPVRLRVYNVFKGWLESHWRDETDREALALIEPFAEYRLATVLPSAGRRLLELARRVNSSDGTLVPRLVSSIGKTNTSMSQYVPADTPLPLPVIGKNLQHSLANFKLGGTGPAIMDFDPVEIARQITIRQMNIFSCIMPEELLGSQWMKKGGVGAPNVKAMSALSTDLSNLVGDTILECPEVKKRAAVIKQWIKIAHQCFELHNYDALMAIICSLNSSTITRLRRTWDLVSPKRRDMLKTLQAIVEPAQNNKVLRGRLHDHVPPCLPFLGMYLTDLTFVDIGNPATKQLPGQDGGSDASGSNGGSSSGLTVVNFDKHTRTAKIIGELQRFQIPYRLTEVPDIQEWIGDQISRVHGLNNAQVSYYRKSLLLEPRETQALKSAVDAAAGMGATASGAASIKEPPARTDLFAWMRGGNTSGTANNSANNGLI